MCSGRGSQLPPGGLPAHRRLGHRDSARLQGVPGALPRWRWVALRDRGGDRTEEAEQVRFGGHSGLAIGERAADYSLALQIPGEDRWGTLNPKPPSPTNDSPPPPPPFRGGLLRQYCNWASMTNCWPPPLPLQRCCWFTPQRGGSGPVPAGRAYCLVPPRSGLHSRSLSTA